MEEEKLILGENCERFYIVDSTKKNGGSCDNILIRTNKGLEFVQFAENPRPNFEDYKKIPGQENLVLLTEYEMIQRINQFTKDLQGEFEEITEEQFWYGLECVPPKKSARFGDIWAFFGGECYTHSIYTLYFQFGDRYFSAYRSINIPTDDLHKEITNFCNNLKGVVK